VSDGFFVEFLDETIDKESALGWVKRNHSHQILHLKNIIHIRKHHFIHAKIALSFLNTCFDLYYSTISTYPNSQQIHHLQIPFEDGQEHAESSHPSGNNLSVLIFLR